MNALIARPKAIRSRKQKIGVKRRASREDTEGADDMILTEEKHTFGPSSVKFLNTVMNEESRKAKIDSVFGIRSEVDAWKIGNKRVTLNSDDIMVVGGETYKGTPGFW